MADREDLDKIAGDLEAMGSEGGVADSDVKGDEGEPQADKADAGKPEGKDLDAIDFDALSAFLDAGEEPETMPPVLQDDATPERSQDTDLAQSLERLRAELDALRSQKTEEPSTAPKSLLDCVDASTGEIDINKLEAYIAAQRETAKSEVKRELEELRQGLRMQQEKEKQEAIAATVEAMEAAWKTAEKAFPHFRSSQEAQLKVAKKLNDWFNMEKPQELILAAYAIAYPEQYAEAIMQYRESKKGKASEELPATPPAVRKGQPKPQFKSDEERIDAIASELEKMLKGG